MARRIMTGALLLALLSAGASEVHAQLFGGNRKPSSSSTLASRLGKLKSAFLREDSKKDEKQQPESSLYRGNQGPVPPEDRVANIPDPTRQNRRVQQGDFLPKGIFDRNASPGHRGSEQAQSDALVAPLPRRGSAVSALPSKAVRKSPEVSREDELQEALSDLLHEDDHAVEETSPSGSGLETEVGGFDMRKVLIEKSQQHAESGSSQTATSVSEDALNDLREKMQALAEQASDKQPTLELPDFSAPGSTAHESRNSATLIEESAPRSLPRFDGGLPLSRRFLTSTNQPVITSSIAGPPQILIDREATYRVSLENGSDESARNVEAEVQVPEWAEVVDVISTSGVVERSTASGPGVLKWRLEELGGRNTQSLVLKLIARSGKPLHLTIKWTQAPVASQAMVEVQEPKLEMRFSGPQEVRYNQPQRFELLLRNPGTGPAENVVIRLVPPGGDEQSASTHQVGKLSAGEEKRIELELTAREAGQLQMKASATAQGGLEAVAHREVLCRKAELEVDWRGPQENYAGTETPYYFRVRNVGTADAENIVVQLSLPSGVRLVSASEGYELDKKTGSVSWQLPNVAAGQEEFLQVRCLPERAGTCRLELLAQDNRGELLDAKEIATNVIAVADLKLSVTDPKGPVPVGETAVYEIRIRNRGTTNAQNVGVVGLFSEGIDPTAVEGAQFTVRDGRVSIHPINSLPAGQELVLRIRAVASQPGTHIFRAEVSCQDLEIKLAAEETTRFYEDQYRWEDGETAYASDPEGAVNR